MAPVTTNGGGISPVVQRDAGKQRKVDIVFLDEQLQEKPAYKASQSRLKFKLPKSFIKHANLDGPKFASMMLNKGSVAETPKDDLLSPRSKL